jgi:iron complex outermembrane receptor protein
MNIVSVLVKRCVLAATCSLALTCGTGVAAQAPPAAPNLSGAVEFRIDAQSVSEALKQFASQAGVQLVYETRDIDPATQASRLAGSFTPEAALTRLLAHTNLEYRFINSRTVSIRYAQAAVAPATTSIASDTPRMKLAAATTYDSVELQEVVITAQKREERLIDTPQSVSVITGDELNKLGATQFRDFANTVPGLGFATAGAGDTAITLRGVTTGYDVGPLVGIYVDEVPYGASSTFVQASQLSLDAGLFDLNRIEVLRGPQGTLYGASTMGGLIKYVTKQPDTHTFSGDAQAGLSQTGDGGGTNYNVAAAVNVPLKTDVAALRASGYETHDGGFIDNVALNQKNVNRADIYGGRLDFLLTPTDALSIRLTGFAQNISRDGEGTATYTSAGQPIYGPLQQYRLFEEPFYHQFRLISGTVTYDFGPVALTSISSYQKANEHNFWDASAVYVPELNGFGLGPYGAIGVANSNDVSKTTQEIRLASKKSTFLEWLVGGFYTRESSNSQEYMHLRDPGGTPLPNNLFSYINPSTFKEYAAFGNLTWHVTQRIDLTGGLRYADNKQTSDQIGSGLLVAPGKGSSDQSVVTYLGNALYHFTPQATAYLRYATGYRPGGPNFLVINPATGKPSGPSSFKSDSLDSYELGFKANSENRRFGIDVDVYDIEWKGIQLNELVNGFSAIVNAPGGARVQGGEATLTARPVQDVTVTAALAYTHSYLKQAVPALGAAQGERLPNTPRFSGSLNGDYRLPIDSTLKPNVGASFRYISDRRASFDGDMGFPQYRLPAYAVFDVRGGLTISSAVLQLYVHNVFDKRGQIGDLNNFLGTRIGIEQPRTVGVQASYAF